MKMLSRRQVVLGLAGASAIVPSLVLRQRAAAIKPDPFPSCTLTPEQTEGPFYFEPRLIRSDIREGRPGQLLTLRLKVVESGPCTPIRDAVVDVWHCDALGEYSGYEAAASFGPRGERREDGPPPGAGGPPPGAPPGGMRQARDNDKTFFRGAQVTDASGEVEFTTIYPGWYPGRTPHIHIKVHLDNDEALTSQMYFPDELTDRVYKAGVYSEHTGRRLRNDDDGIYRGGSNGPLLTLTPVDDGFVGTMTLGVSRG
jgi:protocatechuate 3,4-dioxygenase beta subunit